MPKKKKIKVAKGPAFNRQFAIENIVHEVYMLVKDSEHVLAYEYTQQVLKAASRLARLPTQTRERLKPVAKLKKTSKKVAKGPTCNKQFAIENIVREVYMLVKDSGHVLADAYARQVLRAASRLARLPTQTPARIKPVAKQKKN